jgi:hypothetical protein
VRAEAEGFRRKVSSSYVPDSPRCQTNAAQQPPEVVELHPHAFPPGPFEWVPIVLAAGYAVVGQRFRFCRGLHDGGDPLHPSGHVRGSDAFRGTGTALECPQRATRLEPELRDALIARAERDHETTSSVLRKAALATAGARARCQMFAGSSARHPTRPRHRAYFYRERV